GKLRIAVIRQNDRGKFEIVGHQSVEKYTLDRGKVRFEGTALKQIIEELALEEDTPRPVNFIGHSYGGDLAVRTALSLDRGVKVENLVTIDPIDIDTCTHTDVTWERTGLLFGQLPKVIKGCTEAPVDVTREEQAELLHRTGNQWYHFYQKL